MMMIPPKVNARHPAVPGSPLKVNTNTNESARDKAAARAVHTTIAAEPKHKDPTASEYDPVGIPLNTNINDSMATQPVAPNVINALEDNNLNVNDSRETQETPAIASNNAREHARVPQSKQLPSSLRTAEHYLANNNTRKDPTISRGHLTGALHSGTTIRCNTVEFREDDDTVSTLGSLVTKEGTTSRDHESRKSGVPKSRRSKSKQQTTLSTDLSTVTELSEIDRLRKENDRLREELLEVASQISSRVSSTLKLENKHGLGDEWREKHHAAASQSSKNEDDACCEEKMGDESSLPSRMNNFAGGDANSRLIHDPWWRPNRNSKNINNNNNSHHRDRNDGRRLWSSINGSTALPEGESSSINNSSSLDGSNTTTPWWQFNSRRRASAAQAPPTTAGLLSRDENTRRASAPPAPPTPTTTAGLPTRDDDDTCILAVTKDTQDMEEDDGDAPSNSSAPGDNNTQRDDITSFGRSSKSNNNDNDDAIVASTKKEAESSSKDSSSHHGSNNTTPWWHRRASLPPAPPTAVGLEQGDAQSIHSLPPSASDNNTTRSGHQARPGLSRLSQSVRGFGLSSRHLHQSAVVDDNGNGDTNASSSTAEEEGKGINWWIFGKQNRATADTSCCDDDSDGVEGKQMTRGSSNGSHPNHHQLDVSFGNKSLDSLEMGEDEEYDPTYCVERSWWSFSSGDTSSERSDDDGTSGFDKDDTLSCHNGHDNNEVKVEVTRAKSLNLFEVLQAQATTTHDDAAGGGSGNGADDSLLELMGEEEKYENAKWRMRMMDESVFRWNYMPQNWEKQERWEIVKFLSLEDPKKVVEEKEKKEAEYCWKVLATQLTNTEEQKVQMPTRHDSHDEEEEPMQDSTKTNAISSIFFPKRGDTESILLKRGRVLVDGEERELMVFTYGFVLSRVELDSLVNLLLNATSSNSGSSDKEDLTLEQVAERFCSLDADGSGTLDRSEIHEAFRRSGIALSERSLNTLMKRLDPDSDGEISVEEFKAAMMQEIEGNKPSNTRSKASFSWRTLGTKFKKTPLAKDGVRRNLEVALQMSDIEKIEHIGLCHGSTSNGEIGTNNNKALDKNIEEGLAHQSFAIHLRGVIDPLVVTCATPAHVEPWMEAFHKCIDNLKLHSDASAGHAGLIQGVDLKEKGKVKTNRKYVEKWRGGAIDWSFDESFSI